MLLGIDVGNTQMVIGMYSREKLLYHWRLSTQRDRTADEMALTIGGFFGFRGHTLREVDGMVVSSVVPEMTFALTHMARDILKLEPLIIDQDTDTGVPILYDDPRQVGADRVVNAAAAIKKYGTPCVVVDFGTATTLDAINEKGEYLGGTIMPGVEISSDALYRSAARLSRVDLVAPPDPIGRSTSESIQSGIIFGTAGQVDRLVELFVAELGPDTQVVATGGLAEVVIGHCRTVEKWDALLTLDGLKIIYERNQGREKAETS